MNFTKLRKMQFNKLRDENVPDNIKSAIALSWIGNCQVCEKREQKNGAQFSWNGTLLCEPHFDEVKSAFDKAVEEKKKSETK